MSFEIERGENLTEVRFEGGYRFEMPAITDADMNAQPIQIFHNTLPLLDEAFSKLKSIKLDTTLSAIGIDQKSDPVRAEMTGRVAAVAGQIALFDHTINNMEAQLFALPNLELSHTVVAIEDREIRDWWRSMDTKKRISMLDQIGSESEKHERLMIALMRAPAPLALLDHETKVIGEVWKDAKRKSDPDTAARIENDRRLVETSRRGLMHLAGITSRVAGWKGDSLLRSLLSSPFELAGEGLDIYGFTKQQVAQMRRNMAA